MHSYLQRATLAVQRVTLCRAAGHALPCSEPRSAVQRATLCRAAGHALPCRSHLQFVAVKSSLQWFLEQTHLLGPRETAALLNSNRVYVHSFSRSSVCGNYSIPAQSPPPPSPSMVRNVMTDQERQGHIMNECKNILHFEMFKLKTINIRLIIKHIKLNCIGCVDKCRHYLIKLTYPNLPVTGP